MPEILVPSDSFHYITDTNQPPAPPVPSKYTRRGADPKPPKQGLNYYSMEVSYGGTWIDLNDGYNYKVGAETMASTQVQWRKVMAESPITEGSYVVHAVRALVTENIQIYVHGADMWMVNENLAKLEQLFARLDFSLRITMDWYRETWRCQTAEWSSQRSQVMSHNYMAVFQVDVPRFPTVTREILT